MAEQTFETFIEKERERLGKERESALRKRQEADEQLAVIQRELNAISAYEEVRRGKGETKPRKPRAARGKRDTVLNAIKESSNGATRADLLEKMNVKGDKSGEQFVSNALSALKKQGKIHLENGVYTIVRSAQ